MRSCIGLLTLTLAAEALSSRNDSWNSPPFEVRDLKERNDQYIINPCPEFLGLPKQTCGQSSCGRDSKIKGICDNVRLNGLQDQRCRFAGGCGDYCLCTPPPNPGYAQVAPAYAVQFIGIMCPEQYGLPKQKCSDPKCGGDGYYEGYCNNILVSGAQGPGCRSPGCGIYCDCDNSPGSASSVSWTLVPNTTWVSGTATLYSTSSTAAAVSTTQRTLTSSSSLPSVAGLSTTSLETPTSRTSAKPATISSSISNTFSGTSSNPSESSTASDPLFTSLWPVSSQISVPGPTSSGGMIIPIIPIVPIVPPAGFPPPPPGTPETTEQCPADYQETKCGDCGGESGWCQQPPNQGCPCQEACTTGDNMPDCNDAQCEGEENKCTIGPQKDCECKPGCPVGIDGPRCDDTTCEGVSEGKCTTGQYAGCDCIQTGNYIAETEDLSWPIIQQGILNLMAINAPNGAYSSFIGTATASLMPSNSTPTASTMISMTLTTTKISMSSTLSSPGSMITQPSNVTMSASSLVSNTAWQLSNSPLTTQSATTTINSQTCYTVRSYTICQIPKATVIDGHTTTEEVTTTLSPTSSQASATFSQTCYTVRSYTLCVKPVATVLNGDTTTEMMTTTLGLAVANTTTPRTTSPQSPTSSPVPTSPPMPTGPMYGVYIALGSNTYSIPQPNGLPPIWIYSYNDLIWVSAAPATSSDNLLAGPQYCATKSVESTITITHIPTFSQPRPYPTARITSLHPSGASGPSCDWIPSPNNDEPGSLSCDASPTSVECAMPFQAATTCGSVDNSVEPMVQCIWQGE